jgi:hypothetical protein
MPSPLADIEIRRSRGPLLTRTVRFVRLWLRQAEANVQQANVSDAAVFIFCAFMFGAFSGYGLALWHAERAARAAEAAHPQYVTTKGSQ